MAVLAISAFWIAEPNCYIHNRLARNQFDADPFAVREAVATTLHSDRNLLAHSLAGRAFLRIGPVARQSSPLLLTPP